MTDFTDRTTCVLFGDGAGAVVLEPTDEPVGLFSSELGMDGSVGHILSVPRDGSAGDPGPTDPRESAIGMEGPEIFRRAVTTMGDSAARAIKDAGLSLEDVDLVVPHQANTRIIDATARRLGIDESKVFVNIESYGNTSAATIPVALTEAWNRGGCGPATTSCSPHSAAGSAGDRRCTGGGSCRATGRE